MHAVTISKEEFNARMLEILHQIEASGQELIVTDHGKPVLKIVPLREKATVEELFDQYSGQVVYHEDIDAPTTDEWSMI